MKRYFVLFVVIVGWLNLISCGSEEETNFAELDLLKKQIREDSIFRENWAKESRDIDELLSQVSGFTDDAQGGLLENDDLLSKAKSVESIVEEANEKIAQLEREVSVQKKKSRRLPNLVQNIKKQKNMILEQDSIIKVLQNRIEEGDVIIKKMGTKINLQGKTIEEQEVEINKKMNELLRKEQHLIAKQNELEATKKKSAADLKRQKNSFHINAGLDRINIVVLAKGMASKKKQQILDEAWNHFCDAHKGGDYNALTEMGKLQSNSTLGKFVKNKSCD
jgi:hypothetical protein